MSTNKPIYLAARGLIPIIMLVLAGQIDPAKTTDIVLAWSILKQLLESVAGNWFTDVASDSVNEVIDKLRPPHHYKHSHLAQAIGRAFAKTFDDLSKSFRQSETYQDLRRQGELGETKIEHTLTLLNEIGVQAKSIFSNQKKLSTFANKSADELQKLFAQYGKGEVAQIVNVQETLKFTIKSYLVDQGCESEVIDFVLNQIDEKLIENFQKELQNPESGTSAWRAWMTLKNQQLLKTTHETHEVVIRVEEKIDKILQSRSTPVPNQIPAYLDRDLFVGRQPEIKQIKALLLNDKKLCAIWGMPGIGKSAVAKQNASELQKDFVDGVLWLEAADDIAQTLDEKLLPFLEKIARA